MDSYRLTADADADIAAIYEYSVLNFGEKRADGYLLSLLETLDLIAASPRMGADRSHIKPGYRRHVHAAHIIYYRICEADVLVLRILGARQDPERHL